jgi:hypothetical protein
MNTLQTNQQASKHRNLLAPNSTRDATQPDKPVNQFHHIDRMDNDAKRNHTWRVFVTRNNVAKTKRFNDEKYGGKEEALKAAIRYRDEFLAKTDHLAHQIWLRTILRRNNTSGIPGVARYSAMSNGNPNIRLVYWYAIWTDERGVSRRRQFSVLHYGEEEAKRLAIAEREQQLKRVCTAKSSHWTDPNIAKTKKL